MICKHVSAGEATVAGKDEVKELTEVGQVSSKDYIMRL